MKTRTRIVLIVVIALVAAGFGVAFYADTIAKGAVVKGSEQALGVSTSVGGVRLGVLGGDFGISSYEVRSPEGFAGEHLFRLERADLSVGMKTVLRDTVVIERLSLDGIALDLEMVDGKTNYGAVLDHMRGMSRRPGAGPGATPGDKPEKSLVIDEVVIRGITARARMSASKLGVEREVTVEVPEIRLQGVGRKQGGVTLAELVSVVLARVMDAVLREGGDIPDQLRAALDGRVKGLLRAHRRLIEGVSLSGGEDAVKEAKDEAVDKAKDAIQGLLKDN
jgi:hypothetical protein